MELEEYLEFFKEKEVPIQITLDLGNQPTVHALYRKEVGEKRYIQMTEAKTLLEALEKMKVKLFGHENDWHCGFNASVLMFNKSDGEIEELSEEEHVERMEALREIESKKFLR